MAMRSLKVEPKYQEKVKKAAKSMGLTQKAIAIRLNCSSQPVSRFFNGKPVSFEILEKICRILKLDWQEITDLSEKQCP